MGNRQHGFIFYVFWMTMLFLGSVVLIFFLYMVVPRSLLDSLKGDRISLSDSQENTEYSKMNRFTRDNNTMIGPSISTEKHSLGNTDASKQGLPLGTTENMYDNIAHATIFGNSRVQKKGTFTTDTGSTYVVGTLALTGMYPNDFDVPIDKNIQIPVAMTVTIGWKDLPSFHEIELLSRTTPEYRVLVPSLEMLSMQIPTIKSLSRNTNRLIAKNIKAYLYTIFERRYIPEQIVLQAQQQLASDYVIKGYENITIIPFQ